jgi:hypothetical protein
MQDFIQNIHDLEKNKQREFDDNNDTSDINDINLPLSNSTGNLCDSNSNELNYDESSNISDDQSENNCSK